MRSGHLAPALAALATMLCATPTVGAANPGEPWSAVLSGGRQGRSFPYWSDPALTPGNRGHVRDLSSAQNQQPSVAEQIALADREIAARRTVAARAALDAALAMDARSYDALWRRARVAVDIGEASTDRPAQKAAFRDGVSFATRAMAANPNHPEGHFQLARALGREALTVGSRERVKYALDVRTHALRALELEPKHPGSLHVMGMWNAEIMRLNGVARMIAKTFMGGAVMGTASWAEAARYLEQAVAVEPDRVVHHLDLARVYRDTKRGADARREYEAAVRCPLVDPSDTEFKRQATSELAELR